MNLVDEFGRSIWSSHLVVLNVDLVVKILVVAFGRPMWVGWSGRIGRAGWSGRSVGRVGDWLCGLVGRVDRAVLSGCPVVRVVRADWSGGLVVWVGRESWSCGLIEGVGRAGWSGALVVRAGRVRAGRA